MPAPSDLTDDVVAAIERHNLMTDRANAWAAAACPFFEGQVGLFCGRTATVQTIRCRYIVDDHEIIWLMELVDADGVEFTMSERSMPSPRNPQN